MTNAIKKHLGDFTAMLVLFAIALFAAGYIIANQTSRGTIPFFEEQPIKIKAEFSDAQAVTPGQGQTVRVAGVQVGRIVDVQPKDGVAVVTLAIEPKYWKKLAIRTDATALLRPRTGLKDMFIELDPGSAGQKLKKGAIIPAANTSPDIDPDEVLSALDTDTRSYLQLLVGGLGKGFKGNGDSLNAIFKRLGPTQRDLNRVSSAVAERRTNLMRLIHNYQDLTNEVADKDGELTRLVQAANATFRGFAAANPQISQAVALLPSTLQQTKQTLVNVNSFSKVLGPSLESLRPAFRELNVANHKVLPFVKEAYPITKDKIRPFVRAARPYVRDLKPAAQDLAIATPDLTGAFHELNRFFNIGAFNPNGAEKVANNLAQDKKRDEGYLFWLGWVSHLTTSLFSTSDAQGPYRRALAAFTCQGATALVHQTPLAEPLYGLTNALADPALCGNNGAAGGALGGLPIPPLPKGNSAKAKAARKAAAERIAADAKKATGGKG
jgi:phospholipid/cholesterol/gamma-HCH transport system substrate-binding protein